jgi:hypothetical protein
MDLSENESLSCEAALTKLGFELEIGRFFRMPLSQKSTIHSSEGSCIIMLPAK